MFYTCLLFIMHFLTIFLYAALTRAKANVRDAGVVGVEGMELYFGLDSYIDGDSDRSARVFTRSPMIQVMKEGQHIEIFWENKRRAQRARLEAFVQQRKKERQEAQERARKVETKKVNSVNTDCTFTAWLHRSRKSNQQIADRLLSVDSDKSLPQTSVKLPFPGFEASPSQGPVPDRPTSRGSGTSTSRSSVRPMPGLSDGPPSKSLEKALSPHPRRRRRQRSHRPSRDTGTQPLQGSARIASQRSTGPDLQLSGISPSRIPARPLSQDFTKPALKRSKGSKSQWSNRPGSGQPNNPASQGSVKPTSLQFSKASTERRYRPSLWDSGRAHPRPAGKLLTCIRGVCPSTRVLDDSIRRSQFSAN